jgi:hypothetical protein
MPRGTDRYDEARLQGRLWTPAIWRGTSKLARWYDCGDFSVTVSGTEITVFRDKSGNALNAANSAGATRYPVWSATGWKTPTRTMPSALYDASNDRADFTAVSYAAGASGYAAVERITGAAIRYLWSGITGAGELRFDGTGKLQLVRSGQLDIHLYSTAASVGMHIVGIEATTNFSRLWMDGLPETQTAVNPGFNGWGGVLGIYGTGGNLALGGAMPEVILSAVRNTDLDSYLVQGYLAWKWGLVDNLSPAHPYKNRPPLIGD